MEYGGKKRQVALSIPPECIREEKSMREKKKTVVTLLLCFALLFGAVGAFVATRPAVAEEKTANVIAVNKINTAAGIQIKLTFDQVGDNGNPTILPLRAYLKDVLGGLSEEAQGGIYFSGDEVGELKNLEINIPAAEVEKLPRVIVLGGEGMDINRGADGPGIRGTLFHHGGRAFFRDGKHLAGTGFLADGGRVSRARRDVAGARLFSVCACESARGRKSALCGISGGSLPRARIAADLPQGHEIPRRRLSIRVGRGRNP